MLYINQMKDMKARVDASGCFLKISKNRDSSRRTIPDFIHTMKDRPLHYYSRTLCPPCGN